MPSGKVKLRIFLDNNMRDDLGAYLQHRGHSVVRQRFYIKPDSPDPIVAMTALKADRILFTQDKDFNSQRFQQPRLEKLNRISISGDSATLLDALKNNLHLLEFQWSHCVAMRTRFVAFIKIDGIRFRA